MSWISSTVGEAPSKRWEMTLQAWPERMMASSGPNSPVAAPAFSMAAVIFD